MPLLGNSTNGIPNWKKYVQDNTQSATLKYTIESPTYLFKNVSNTKPEDLISELNVGQEITIAAKTLFKISMNSAVAKVSGIRAFTQKAAKCRVGGETGYILISKIRKPTKPR